MVVYNQLPAPEFNPRFLRCSIFSFLYIDSIVLFLLVIVVSVLLCMTSGYLFGIFKLFLSQTTSLLTQHHCSHNITVHTTSLLRQHHCSDNITAHTTSLLTQHHCSDNITAHTTSLLTQHHYSHNITAHTTSLLRYFKAKSLILSTSTIQDLTFNSSRELIKT